MLGLNEDGNNWKFIVANFVIVFISTFGWELFDKLPTGAFPEPFDIYESVIKSFVATLMFYGINRVSHKEK